jgi:protein O-mannosyl-transferase
MQVHKGILIAIIAIACLAPYYNTLFAGFVWDDNIFIVHNPYLKSFRFLPEFFTHDFWSIGIQRLASGYYRPLLAVSFMLDYSLWQAGSFGYHLSNLAFHIITSILFFLFLKILLKDTLISLFASLIFSAHPIHTESVSFISGRVDILPFIFMLLSLVFFLKYYANKRFYIYPHYQCIGVGVYLISLVSFFLSLLVKEMAITLPLIVLCIDYFFLSRLSFKGVIKNFVRIHLGFFIVLGLYLAMRFYIIDRAFMFSNTRHALNFFAGNSPYWRLFTVIKILGQYTRLLILPYNLKAYYYFAAANSLFEPAVFTSAIALISLVFIAVKNIRKYPVLAFSITWFFITALPVSNIIPIGNIFAERYMYIPSAGFSLAIGFLFSWLLKKNITLHLLNWKAALYAIFLLLIIALGRVTFERNKVWNNEFTFWYETARAEPSSPVAHCNLASAYYAMNSLKEAITEVKVAVGLYPNYYEAFDLLGDIYLKKGLADEAIKAYKIAIDISPDRETAYNSLACAYAKSGRHEEAIEAGLMALNNNPRFDDARYNLALSYTNAGLIYEAIQAYEEYLKISPDNYAALVELGNLYYRKGDKSRARFYWQAALKISQDYKPAQDALKLLKD